MKWIVPREAVTGVTRTGVAYLYALLLVQIPAVEQLLGDGSLELFVVAAGTAIYTGVRWAAERWPVVGYLLVFNTKPDYQQ